MDWGYAGGNQFANNYGGQGGQPGGGGGFMPGSQNSPGNVNRRDRQESLRPVTIKQIVDAREMPNQDGEFTIDGTEISQITFVGKICNISSQATNITYKLDDGTGTIEVKQWVDSNRMESGGAKQLMENAYARAWGKLKQLNSRRHVGATAIRQITDYNEVSYHLLEATAVHLHFSRGPTVDPSRAPASTNSNLRPIAPGTVQPPTATSLPSGLSNHAKIVYKCLQDMEQGSLDGVHIQNIAVKLRMDVGTVERAGDELRSAGRIYPTSDDQTWALLTCA